ncbi:MAG: class I SAM-dependent RNA methyltransferase [Hyphomicrobiales bacterium]|nr:class I SAM-dependent RNA methyltransferase [Hyphomicrobiales bacterium]
MKTIDLNATLSIERLGARGEGVARTPHGLAFVPYALAGEEVIAEVDGERGRLVEILKASPDRIAPFCRYYGECGGCAVQALAPDAYLAWKRSLLVDALANAHLETEVAPIVDAHGAGRRRVVFHARFGVGRPKVGFMRARAHEIVDIEACPLLAPALSAAPRVARDIAGVLAPLGKPLDIAVTATDSGLDVDLRGAGELEFALTQKLVALAENCDLARISNHGVVVIERRRPRLSIGRADLVLPAGAFLQATVAGEEALARFVAAAIGKAAKIADLFAGAGTFALRLAESADVHAVEQDAAALSALSRAARHAQGLRRVSTEARDLFRRPLTRGELDAFDALVFDPPRAGAEAQAREIAASALPLVVAVSCNVQTFARDARILVDGGYALHSATPVDQFRHSAHVETVAVFHRAARKKAKRGLLSR